MQLEVFVRNGTPRRNCTQLIKRLLEVAFLSFVKMPQSGGVFILLIRTPHSGDALLKSVAFWPVSSLFNAKWHEWVCYEFLWWNNMKWYIKWRDMWCNAWNVRCSRNAKYAICGHVCDACDADRSFRLHAMRCNLEFLISITYNEM